MMQFAYIAFFTMLGFFLTPALGYACAQKETKKQTCCEAKGKRDKQKNCCAKGRCSKHGKTCKGECGKSNCQCSNFDNLPCVLPTFAELALNTLILGKIKYPSTENQYQTGFLSIWLLPKIA